MRSSESRHAGQAGHRIAHLEREDGESSVTKLPRVFGLAERGTPLARGKGEFSAGGSGVLRPALMPCFGLFLGISSLLRGVMASRDPGLHTATKMRPFLGSGVPFNVARLHERTQATEGRRTKDGGRRTRRARTEGGGRRAEGGGRRAEGGGRRRRREVRLLPASFEGEVGKLSTGPGTATRYL